MNKRNSISKYFLWRLFGFGIYLLIFYLLIRSEFKGIEFPNFDEALTFTAFIVIAFVFTHVILSFIELIIINKNKNSFLRDYYIKIGIWFSKDEIIKLIGKSFMEFPKDNRIINYKIKSLLKKEKNKK